MSVNKKCDVYRCTLRKHNPWKSDLSTDLIRSDDHFIRRFLLRKMTLQDAFKIQALLMLLETISFTIVGFAQDFSGVYALHKIP